MLIFACVVNAVLYREQQRKTPSAMAGFLIVDAFGASLSLVKRVILSESYSEKPRQQWRGFRFLEMAVKNKEAPGD